MTGSASWQQSGKEEHVRGEAEYDAAQAKGYAEGLTDRVGGYKDSVVGAVKGDEAQQVAGKSDYHTPLFFGLAHLFPPFTATQVTSERRRERSSRKLTSLRAVGFVAMEGSSVFGLFYQVMKISGLYDGTIILSRSDTVVREYCYNHIYFSTLGGATMSRIGT